ncbi:hypothetical protein WDW37_06110 [Bdellovibrionota bacterium FG-1]
MSMSFWVIVSWIFVFILTAINAVVFWKLKQASEQMMKMAFPNAKNMNDALSQMQGMMGGMQGMMGGRGGRPGANPFGGMPSGGRSAPGNAGSKDAQLKAAMDMLSKMKR